MLYYFFKAIILNGQGAKVRPNLPSIDGFAAFSGYKKVKLCIRLAKIKNSSIFANCSPMHTRLPKEQLEETHYWFYTVDQFVNTHAIPMLAYSKRRKAQATIKLWTLKLWSPIFESSLAQLYCFLLTAFISIAKVLSKNNSSFLISAWQLELLGKQLILQATNWNNKTSSVADPMRKFQISTPPRPYTWTTTTPNQLLTACGYLTHSKRNECLFLNQLAIFVQKSWWLKFIWFLPNVRISVYWPQVGHDHAALRNSITLQHFKQKHRDRGSDKLLEVNMGDLDLLKRWLEDITKMIQMPSCGLQM